MFGDEKVRVYVCGSVDENVRKERVEKKVLKNFVAQDP